MTNNKSLTETTAMKITKISNTDATVAGKVNGRSNFELRDLAVDLVLETTHHNSVVCNAIYDLKIDGNNFTAYICRS